MFLQGKITPEQPLHQIINHGQLDNNTQCRICLDQQSSLTNPLISPCLCSGSISKIHKLCLIEWIQSSFQRVYPQSQASKTHECELCHHAIKFLHEQKLFCKQRQEMKKIMRDNCLHIWTLIVLTLISWALFIFLLVQFQKEDEAGYGKIYLIVLKVVLLTILGYFSIFLPSIFCKVVIIKKKNVVTEICEPNFLKERQRDVDREGTRQMANVQFFERTESGLYKRKKKGQTSASALDTENIRQVSRNTLIEHIQFDQ